MLSSFEEYEGGRPLTIRMDPLLKLKSRRLNERHRLFLPPQVDDGWTTPGGTHTHRKSSSRFNVCERKDKEKKRVTDVFSRSIQLERNVAKIVSRSAAVPGRSTIDHPTKTEKRNTLLGFAFREPKTRRTRNKKMRLKPMTNVRPWRHTRTTWQYAVKY